MRRDQGVYLFVKIEAACTPKAAPPACDPSALDPVAGLPLPSPGGPGCWLSRLLTAWSEGLKVLPQGCPWGLQRPEACSFPVRGFSFSRASMFTSQLKEAALGTPHSGICPGGGFHPCLSAVL